MKYEPYDPLKHGKPPRSQRASAVEEIFAAVARSGPTVVQLDTELEAHRFRQILYAAAKYRGIEITIKGLDRVSFVVGLRGRDKFTKA